MKHKMTSKHMKEYAHMSAGKLKKHMKEEKSLLSKKEVKKPHKMKHMKKDNEHEGHLDMLAHRRMK